jgi:hypothetical protein
MKKSLLICLLSILSINTRAQLPNYVSADSLVSWYSFSGNANDSSGHGNNGTVFGATLTTDRFGHPNSAYSFDGVSGYIKSDSAAGYLSDTLTVSFWASYSADFGYDNVISFGDVTGERWGCINGFTYLRFSVGRGCSGTGNLLNYITDTGWHMITYVMEDTSQFIYYDGVYVGTETNSQPSSLSCAATSLWFGVDPFSSPAYYQGKLDDIGIWKRALTQCEITELFNGTSFITNIISNDTVLSGGVATYTLTDTGGAATYQWQENTGSGFSNLSNITPYSGVTTKTLTVNPVSAIMNEYQYRCVRNGGSCIDTSNTALLILTTTGIAELTKESFTISPNPANNTLNINAQSRINDVEIFNVIGKRVFYQHYNSNKISVDVSSLEQGFYFIKINNGLTQKLIKE